MKGSLNALKKVGIVLLLIVSTLLMLVPNKVKAVDTINAENNGTYRINVKNGEYIINMKMGDTIHLEFWVGGKRESFVQDWHWTKEGGSGRTQVISVDDNDKFIGKDSVYVTGTQTGHCTFKVHNFLQTRKATITFNVYEEPFYIVAPYNTNKVANLRSDINNDGLVTNMDELILNSYINGEDVGIEDIAKLNISGNVNENNDPIIDNDDLGLLRIDLAKDDINTILKDQTIRIGIKNGYNLGTDENIKVISDNPNIVSCSGNTLSTVGEGIATITIMRNYNWDTTGSDGKLYQKTETFKIKVVSSEIQDENFIYKIVNGQAIVVKCINTSNGPITIPSQVNGYEVVGIGDNAFGETKITKITIPSTVTSIKSNAFNCPYLKEIEVEEGNPVYFSVNGILYAKIDDNNYALIRCPRDWNGTSVEISDLRVKTIGAYAFYGCENLESITLPSSITTIMEYAFNGCTGIEALALPNNISTLISTNGNIVTTDIFTGITLVGYEKTEGEGSDKVYTDTYSKMSEYIKTCNENGDTTFVANGEDIEITQTSHDYGKVQIGEDGILNVNMKLGETSRYEVTINVGDTFKIVPSKSRDYSFGFDSDDGIDYSSYLRITKSSTGTIVKSFEYSVEGIKKTEKNRGAKIVLSYQPLGGASFYKAIIKVNIEEPSIYIIGNEQDELKLKGDLNGDNLLSEIDLRYFDLYRDGDSSINWINFDFDNDNIPTSNDVTLFNKETNKAYIDGEIELFVKRDKGADKESKNIEFKSETPNIAVVEGNKVKFIAEGKAIITANRMGQERKDTIEFDVTSRVKESDGCKYIINEDGTITIIEYNIPVINGEVGLPAMIDGIRVTGIGANIFKNNEDKDKIKVVIIPKYVTEISEDAFNDLKNLEEFQVEEGNEKFIAYEKVLYKYNDAGDELILVRCPNTFTELEIPAQIDEIKVTEIANKAFYKNENITSITTTSNILKIGNSAFEGCIKLSKNIGIPTGLKYLGDKAFAGCIGLENIELEIPTTLVEIGNEVFNGAKIKAVYYFKYEGYEIMYDYINETVFKDEDGNIIGQRVRGQNDIPTEAYIMKDAQFEDENTGILYQIIKNSDPAQVQVVGLSDKAQGEIEIPASIFIKDGQIVEEGTEGATEFLVTKMIELSLSTNADVTSFVVGENVNEIASNTFRNLTNLERIDIVPGNTKYISDGGILYRIKDTDANGNPKSLILVKYPNKKEGTSFTINKVKGIPVVGIEEYAFEGSKDLTKLNISDNIETIGAYAFYNCEKLQNLVIPETAELGRNVFEGIKGPVIEYITDSYNGEIKDAIRTYLVEAMESKFDGEQYILMWLNPQGYMEIKMLSNEQNPTEFTIDKIKFTPASGKSQEENIADYRYYEETQNEENGVLNAKVRIKNPGSYTVNLIDKDLNEVTVTGIEIKAEDFRYLINYHPNVEKENIVKMPETGTKAINASTTVTEVIPQARGKIFIEWNTEPDGTGRTYELGEEYSENADLDLYAIWKTEDEAIDKIEIIELPKTNYVVGQTFARSGLKIKVTYGNGNTKEITTGYTIENENEPITKETNEIVIKYVENHITKTCSLPITVIDKKITELRIEGTPIEQLEGTKFNKKGLTVKAIYNDETEVQLNNDDYIVNDGNDLLLGQESVVIKYTDPSGLYAERTLDSISVRNKKLQSIEITKEPKLRYIEGQFFDTTEMEITAKYDNGSTKVINKKTADENGYILSDESMLTAGSKIITILYTEEENVQPKSATRVIVIEHKKVENISVEEPTDVTAYVEGQKFDKSKIKVTAKYNDESEVILSPEEYTVNNDQKLTLGQNTAIVEYTYTNTHDEANTVNAECSNFQTIEKELIEITAEIPEGTVQNEGIPFNTEGLEVRAKFNDGSQILLSPEEYTIDNKDANLTSNTNFVIIRYKYTNPSTNNQQEKTFSLPINVAKRVLSRIEITTQPTNKENNIEGTTFKPEGMVVTAIYSNGDRKEISGYTLSNNVLTIGENTIQVNYTEDEITVEPVTIEGIQAREKSLLYISLDDANISKTYIEGEMFNTDNLKVYAHYDNGQEILLEEGYIVNGGKPLTQGLNQEINVSYNNKVAIINGVNVDAKPLPSDFIKGDSEIKITDNKYIENIQPSTTTEKLNENIVEGYTLKIFKADKETEVTTELIGTGMIAVVYKGDTKILEYEIVVKGDVTGDGKAEFMDMVKINRFRLKKTTLQGAYLKAGDTNNDTSVDFMDIVKINRFRLGKTAKL